jgi:hypothetical protein
MQRDMTLMVENFAGMRQLKTSSVRSKEVEEGCAFM